MPNVRYQAIGPLLSGEGSRAFLGLQITDDSRAMPVVLVWVPEGAISQPAQVAQLVKETARAAALHHPNIIRVYGLAQVDEGLARVVEYADGETLRRVLDVAGTLPSRLAAFVAAEVAMGVHFAHLTGGEDEKPFVHGDIRPETVLVSFSGLCKMSGYGALSVAPKEMNGQRIKGRRAHIAPEQVTGGREAATVETDVYLLGILLYECLTGMVAFGEDANFENAVVQQPLKLQNLDAIPSRLASVLAKATAKQTKDRYPSALAFRVALENALGGLPPASELGAYLRSYFPEADEVRAARRREIEAGIAEFSKRRGASVQVSLPEEPPEVPAGLTASIEEAPVAKPPAPRASPAAPAAPAPAPKVASTLRPALLGACAALLLAYYLWGRPPRPTQEQAPPIAARVVPKPAEPEAEPQEEGGEEGDEETKKPPAPTTATHAQAPRPPAAPKPPPPPPSPKFHGPVELELQVIPPVDVSINGKKVGRTPLTLPLPAGKHNLVLTDAQNGIRVQRTLSLPLRPKFRQEIELSKGSVSVNAPPGARVSVDGKFIGNAPISEFPVYEGNHRIVVTVGAAKWQQAFAVSPGENMSFDVYSTEE
jgi:serine/threonine-protein kinase